METPRQLGYRWPAEWEPHAATWVSWPHNGDTWPGKLDVVVSQFVDLVQTLARYEPVHVLAGGETAMDEARRRLGDTARVALHPIPTNDAWCRDHGPAFLSHAHEEPALVDWSYNAWGNKYPPYDLDNAVPLRIAERTGRRRFSGPLVLEGGALETNGRGILLTTASCVQNANRNPGLTRDRAAAVLSEYLGADTVIWLRASALAGDDTDGHVDQLARFVGPDTIVVAVESESGGGHQSLERNRTQLEQFRDETGASLTVIPLPLPGAKWHAGHRLPASYCNFYIANGVVVVPRFEDPGDRHAVAILRDCFPDRDVIDLPALDLVWGFGAFHCLTQHECVATAPGIPPTPRASRPDPDRRPSRS